MVKKNIKTEKFSFYTFLLILCILFGLLIAGALRDALFEYLPKTNLFGDSDIAKESKIRIYNEGDIFRPFFAILFWVTASMVIIFIVNFFRKDFAHNVLNSMGLLPKNNPDYYKGWLFYFLGIPIFWSIAVTLIQGGIHFINTTFNKSISHDSIFIFIFLLWILWILIEARKSEK
jgi:hypothetical protein